MYLKMLISFKKSKKSVLYCESIHTLIGQNVWAVSVSKRVTKEQIELKMSWTSKNCFATTCGGVANPDHPTSDMTESLVVLFLHIYLAKF